MGTAGKIILVAFALGAVYLGVKLNSFLNVAVPRMEDTWWGPGRPSDVDTKIKQFKISVSDKVLEDLKHRLNNTRTLTPPLEGVQQQYGMNTNLLNEIVEFWKTQYDWKEREKFLNKYPQFVTNIQGLDIHFIHVKPQKVPANVKILPLLMLHGWPGSIREFYEIIPMLTEMSEETKSRGFIFELIVPSLPGYGFSTGSSKPGFGPAQIGVVLKNLMLRLGFNKFYLQGGDWGAHISSYMAALLPEHILGVHSNMCSSMHPITFLKYFLGSFCPSLIIDGGRQHKMYPLTDRLEGYVLESGYFHIQSTKPDTVGVALNDSPAGLAAYILEKFTTGTNPDYRNREDGGLKLKYSYRDLLDNVMIYWVTNSMTTAMRLYSEGFSKAQKELGVDRIPIKVPYSCAKFPHEIIYMTDELLADTYKKLVHSTDFEEGGHFAAFEVPKLLAGDIWEAMGKMEQSNVEN